MLAPTVIQVRELLYMLWNNFLQMILHTVEALITYSLSEIVPNCGLLLYQQYVRQMMLLMLVPDMVSSQC